MATVRWAIIRLDLSEIAVDRFIQHRLDQTVITVKHVKHVKWAKRWDPATGPIGVSPKLAQDRHGASGCDRHGDGVAVVGRPV